MQWAIFLSVSAEEIVARLQVSCFSYLQTLQNKFSTEQTSYVYILFKQWRSIYLWYSTTGDPSILYVIPGCKGHKHEYPKGWICAAGAVQAKIYSLWNLSPSISIESLLSSLTSILPEYDCSSGKSFQILLCRREGSSVFSSIMA